MEMEMTWAFAAPPLISSGPRVTCSIQLVSLPLESLDYMYHLGYSRRKWMNISEKRYYKTYSNPITDTHQLRDLCVHPYKHSFLVYRPLCANPGSSAFYRTFCRIAYIQIDCY